MHTYYQYLEKQKHLFPTEITEELSVTEISAEWHALSRIELLETLKHLHTLPEDMHEVIYPRSFGDLSFREIGDIMGKSENCKKLYEQSKLKMLHNSSTTPKEIDYFKMIKLPILGIEFAAMTYIFALMTFVGHHLLNDTFPFGMIVLVGIYMFLNRKKVV